MSLQRLLDRDPRLVARDVAETLALLVVPAVVTGLGLALVGGTAGLLTGLFAGGVFGAVLARGRWLLQAERTENGIERTTRPILDPDENPVAQATSFDYDEKYDRFLVVGLVAVGAGAFAAVASGSVPDDLAFWLVVVGAVSWTAALAGVGARDA
jgi:hypothetical protein